MKLAVLQFILFFNRIFRFFQGSGYESSRQNLRQASLRFEDEVSCAIYRFAARGVSCERFVPKHFNRKAVIMYFHGGAYVAGSPGTHRHLICKLAQTAECEVIAPDYRLAPEFPFPYAIDDALNAYDGMLVKYPASQVILAGDSAGAGLALAAALKLKKEGKEVAGIVLFAPWVDLRCEGPAYDKFNWWDHILSPRRLKASAQMYLDGEPSTNPYVSPLLGDLKGLPPVLIQTGTHDLLMQDSRALEQKLEEAGVKVLARYFKGFPHVFHYFWPQFYPAEAALDSAGDWIKSLK